jgi:catechol 2,3-dioxygenase-like lactoylglutathione lyase family enzyme
MGVEQMEYVSIVVDDLAKAIEFFEKLGLEPKDDASVEGAEIDHIVGLPGDMQRKCLGKRVYPTA